MPTREPDSQLSISSSESLGLLVWLGELVTGAQTLSVVHGVDFDSPRTIGRFRLEALLGTGAYGAVFRATDTHLGRRVALKLAWPRVLMDPESSRRFVEEPKTVAGLSHRGIVEVFDFGQIDLAWYIALELIDGPNLAEWLQKQNRVPPRLAAEIVRSVAEAVHFAHQHGVVHRDLKPGNILLRPLAGRRAFAFEPVVTDFGLARGPRPTEGSLLTLSRAVLGTDHYMSPEQIGGKSDEVHAASDIFSLGVVLYELVAGCRPFDAETSDQVRRAICEEDVPSIRRWRREVPRDLETVILKCLEKNPAQRYESAEALAEDLDRFLCGRPIRARRASLLAHGWKWARRRPLAAALVIISLLSAAAIVGMANLWIGDRLAASRQIAAAEAAAAVAEDIERQHQYAEGIRQGAEALRRGGRREVAELLNQCRAVCGEGTPPGIEWNHLDAQIHSADVELPAHPGGATAVRFSPRGGLLVSGGRDGQVAWWSTADWSRQAQTAAADAKEITALAFSADGALLAAAEEEGRVIVYRAADRSVLYEGQLVDGRVFALDWLGDREELAVGGEGAVLKIVDPHSGAIRSRALSVPSQAKSREPGHPDEINSLVYIPGRDALLALLSPRTTHFVAADSLAEILPCPTRDAMVSNGCYVPLEEDYVATTEGQRNIELWRISDGVKVVEIPNPAAIRSLRYSAATGTLLAAARDGTVATFNVRDALAQLPALVRRHAAHDGRAVSVDASPDGNWLASAGLDGAVKLWHQPIPADPFDIALSGQPRWMSISPNGRWLAVINYRAEQPMFVMIFDTGTREQLWSTDTLVPDGPAGAVDYYSFSPFSFDKRGDRILVAEREHVVRRRDARTGDILAEHPLAPPTAITEVRLFEGTDTFAVREPYGHTNIHQFGATASAALMTRHNDSLLGTLATCRGELWLRFDADRQLTLRPGPRAEPLMSLGALSERITVAAVSPDGQLLAAGGIDRIIYVWDLTRNSTPAKLIGHDDTVSGLAFSPDGETLLSSSSDQTVRLWHLPTRSQLLKLGSPEERILSMAVDPTGALLVLGVEHNGRFGLQVHRLRAAEPPQRSASTDPSTRHAADRSSRTARGLRPSTAGPESAKTAAAGRRPAE